MLINNLRYKIYLDHIIKLVGSFIIHLEEDALEHNLVVQDNGFSVNEQKSEWRYYKNLAGEYHDVDKKLIRQSNASFFNDDLEFLENKELMYVTSLDFREANGDTILIPFTRENLSKEVNTQTLRIYREKSNFYNEMIERYPGNISLIDGILFPVDKQKAIESGHGAILYYNRDLVDTQEFSLIRNVEKDIKLWLKRWSFKDMEVAERQARKIKIYNLFVVSFMFVLNNRKKAINTSEACDFHIREKLSSFGNNGDITPLLRPRQKIFLYKYINRLLMNGGKQETFDLMVERLATEIGIPFATYDSTLESLDNTFFDPVTKLSTNVLKIRNLNDIYNDTPDTIDLVDLYDKIRDKAKLNVEIDKDYIDKEKRLIASAKFTDMKTKFLISSITDLTFVNIYNREKMLLDLWPYMAINGKFNVDFIIDNPSTGSELQLSALSAYYLYLYAVSRRFGFTPDKIPDLYFNNVPDLSRPTKEHIKSLIPNYYVDNVRDALESLPDFELNPIDSDFRSKATSSVNIDDSFIDYLIDNLPELERIESLEGFNTLVDKLYRYRNDVANVVDLDPFLTSRSVKDYLHKYLFISRPEVLNPQSSSNLSYPVFFQRFNIDPESLTILEWEIIEKNILNEIIGPASLENRRLSNLQRETVKLIESLSSYTIMFSSEIKTENYDRLDTKSIRVDNPRSTIMRKSFSPIHYDGTLYRSSSIYGIKPMEIQSMLTKRMSNEFITSNVFNMTNFSFTNKTIGNSTSNLVIGNFEFE